MLGLSEAVVMNAPKCEKCAIHPEMIPGAVDKLIDFGVPTRGFSRVQRNAGHPGQALAWTVVNIGMAVGNYFFERVTFTCGTCGQTVQKTRAR